MLAGFLGGRITRTVGIPGTGKPYCQGRLGTRTSLHASTPTPFNRLFRQPAAQSLPRHRVAAKGSTGILTCQSIGGAVRLGLRTRLTLIRLALIRKPWSYGGQVSRLPYRYLYLHLLFQKLQGPSRIPFDAAGMLPYQPGRKGGFRGFGRKLMPDYYPCRTPRLVSCYALFK